MPFIMIQSITVSLSHSFPLQERPPAGPDGPADRQTARPRRAGRAGLTGSRSAATPASAAALDPAVELKERQKDATCASGPEY